jgi:hypothetical protein
MPSDKSLAVSYRVSARFKRLLEAAAARENRSQTNMLETLVFQYCEQKGIDPSQSPLEQPKEPA